jgi:5-methylcytosine-specific restriction protein A
MTYLGTKELLDEVKISRATLYRLIEEGLPFEEVGPRKKMYDPDVVREFIKKRSDGLQDHLVIGKEYSNDDIIQIFRVGIMGGMRRSNTRNALVLISFHSGIDRLYGDYWKDDILYYTGMGQIGDQDIDDAQNKTLAESDTNGITVYLFEMFTEQKYQYRGIVKLAGKPFTEDEVDFEGNMRKVWKFPLKLATPNYLTEDFVEKSQEDASKKVAKILTPALLQLAKGINQVVSEVTTTTKTYVRNPVIARYAKKRAAGVCELCGQKAPFEVDGEPFLESLHIKPVSEGGLDSIDNIAALCPNCHRRVYYLKDPKDIEIIRRNVEADEMYMNGYADEGINLKRVVICPYCNAHHAVNLEDESSVSSDEHSMGTSILYEFDYEEECSNCGETFRVKGYVSEYPAGCIEHEDVEAYKLKN